MANLSNIVVPSNVLTATNTQTVSNKTISFSSNTLTGVAPLASPTFTGTATFATVAATTFSGNPTFSGAPVFSGVANFTGGPTFTGTSSTLGAVFTDVAEVATVSATAATGTINYDVSTQSVLYYTSNASANWTLNIRHSSGTSLNTAMSTGQALTIVHLVTQGGTAYYNSAVTVDGGAITPKWQGGSAPTAGNASSIDVYTYTIIKTGAATFTVFASQTQFK